MPFEKGHPKIPGSGRKKGTTNKYSLVSLQKALERRAKKEGKKSFYDYVSERLFANDQILAVVMKMNLPTLKSVDAIIGVLQDQMSLEEAEAIREKLGERFNKSKPEEEKK